MLEDDVDDNSESEEESEEAILRNFEEEAKMISANLLPQKSLSKYELVYQNFLKWCDENSVQSVTENVLLVYFHEVSKTIKPSTMWAQWSMLKTTLMIKQNVHIANFIKLKAMITNFSKNYEPKKTKSFTHSEVKRFLELADDSMYLGLKTMLIFGICGALRCCEILKITTSDVQDSVTHFKVDIKDTKAKYPRYFIIAAPYYEIVQKYIALRPSDMTTDRFFIYYSKGKCTKQVIGIHKVSEGPKTIALFLNLDNTELYTGHSYRRTAATLMSASNPSLLRLKNLGGWKSDTVCQGYIADSLVVKQHNFKDILSGGQVSTSTNQNVCHDVLNTSNNNERSAGSILNEIETDDNVLDNLNCFSKENESNRAKNFNSTKKRKISIPEVQDKDYNSDNSPIKVTNCENFTININNYCDCKNKDAKKFCDK